MRTLPYWPELLRVCASGCVSGAAHDVAENHDLINVVNNLFQANSPAPFHNHVDRNQMMIFATPKPPSC
jgi:hypothetical protein